MRELLRHRFVNMPLEGYNEVNTIGQWPPFPIGKLNLVMSIKRLLFVRVLLRGHVFASLSVGTP